MSIGRRSGAPWRRMADCDQRAQDRPCTAVPGCAPVPSGAAIASGAPAPSSAPTPLKARFVTGARQGFITAAAAWISYSTSVLFGFKEGYWAAISAIVVMQADLSTTKNSGRDRFVGTALGGLIGWGCAACWHHHLSVYAVAVALTIFACWASNIGNAGRLAAVAVTVIVLIPRDGPIWRIALFRFLEVSWGIAVALALVWLVAWIERRSMKDPV